jgi:hypothetical protein
MKRFKLLGVMLMVLCAMGLMATSAFALPDISITLCTGACVYPLHLNYLSETVKGKLESASGTFIESEGLHRLYSLGELSALGTFRAIYLRFANGAEPSEQCLNTANAGEVLTEGSFHIVYTSLASSGFGLQLGTLYLLNAFTITCPAAAITIKIKGSLVGAIRTPGKENNEQLTGLKSLISGSAGKQQFRAYYNDSSGSLLAQLLCEKTGTAGFKESSQVVGGEPEATALEGKMFVIRSR